MCISPVQRQPRNAINLLINFCHLLNWKLPAAGFSFWMQSGDQKESERESWEIPLDISRILFVLSLPTASPFPHFVDWSPSGLGSSVQLLLIFNCVDFSSTQSPWNEIIYSPVKTLYHRAYSLFRQLSRAHFACNVQIKYSPSFLLSFFVSDLPICDFLWCSSWEPAKVHLKP